MPTTQELEYALQDAKFLAESLVLQTSDAELKVRMLRAKHLAVNAQIESLIKALSEVTYQTDKPADKKENDNG